MVPPVHGDEAGRLLDAAQPGADRRESREGAIATIRDVGVAIERYIRDRELASGKIFATPEVIFHDLQGRIAALRPVFQRMRLKVTTAPYQREPEICRADIRL